MSVVVQKLVLYSFIIFFSVQQSYAVSLNNATSSRDTFTLGDPDARSFDGTGFDAFKPFESFVSGGLLSISAFTGGETGSLLEVFMLQEVTAYGGQNAGFVDNFGVLNSSGDFVSILDSTTGNPGDSASILQGADEQFTFALKAPDAIFSSIDSDNPDGGAHILGAQITTAGTVTIDPANLFGASLTFDLQVGDIVLFIEDLLASGNSVNFIPEFGDFDYNDLVYVVRNTATEVPEPSTVCLMLAGLGALFGVRRREEQKVTA